MAPLPTISDVFRVQLVWNTNVGITPVNVFHVRTSIGTASDVGDTINADARVNQFAGMSAGHIVQGLNITALDGHSAAVFRALAPTKWHGSTSGSDLIPQSAAVVSFRTTQRGSRGRGRMYVGPIAESAQANGTLDSTVSGLLAVAWADFITDMAGDSTPLVVASYLHADAHDVDTFAIDSLVGTQRRRLDQLRT
jgi:hypothetical protein